MAQLSVDWYISLNYRMTDGEVLFFLSPRLHLLALSRFSVLKLSTSNLDLVDELSFPIAGKNIMRVNFDCLYCIDVWRYPGVSLLILEHLN